MASFGDQIAGAAWTKNLAKLKELIPQGDVNMPNSRGQTALYCACRQGYSDIVLELLKAPSINVNVQVTEHGGTPLHAGAKENVANKLGLTAHQDMKEVYKLFTAEGRTGLQKKYPSVKQIPTKSFITAAGGRFRVARSSSTSEVGKKLSGEEGDGESSSHLLKKRMKKTESVISIIGESPEEGEKRSSKGSGKRHHRHKEKDTGSSGITQGDEKSEDDEPSGRRRKVKGISEFEIEWDSLPNFSSFLPTKPCASSLASAGDSESETSSTTGTAGTTTKNYYSLFIECGKVPEGLTGEIRSPFKYIPSPFSYRDQYSTFIHDEPAFLLEEGRISYPPLSSWTSAPRTSPLATSQFSFSRKPPQLILNSERTHVLRRVIDRRRGESVRKPTDRITQDVHDNMAELHGMHRGNSSSSSTRTNPFSSPLPSPKFSLELSPPEMLTFVSIEQAFPMWRAPPLPPFHPRLFGVSEEDQAEQTKKMKAFILNSLNVGHPCIKTADDLISTTLQATHTQSGSKAKFIMKKILKRAANSELADQPSQAISPPSLARSGHRSPAQTLIRNTSSEEFLVETSSPSPPRPLDSSFASLKLARDGSTSPRSHSQSSAIPGRRVGTPVGGCDPLPQQGVLGAISIRPIVRSGSTPRYLRTDTSENSSEDPQQDKSEEEATDANESSPEEVAFPISFPSLPSLPPSLATGARPPLSRIPLKAKKSLSSPKKNEPSTEVTAISEEIAQMPTPREPTSTSGTGLAPILATVPASIQTAKIIPPRIRATAVKNLDNTDSNDNNTNNDNNAIKSNDNNTPPSPSISRHTPKSPKSVPAWQAQLQLAQQAPLEQLMTRQLQQAQQQLMPKQQQQPLQTQPELTARQQPGYQTGLGVPTGMSRGVIVPNGLQGRGVMPAMPGQGQQMMTGQGQGQGQAHPGGVMPPGQFRGMPLQGQVHGQMLPSVIAQGQMPGQPGMVTNGGGPAMMKPGLIPNGNQGMMQGGMHPGMATNVAPKGVPIQGQIPGQMQLQAKGPVLVGYRGGIPPGAHTGAGQFRGQPVASGVGQVNPGQGQGQAQAQSRPGMGTPPKAQGIVPVQQQQQGQLRGGAGLAMPVQHQQGQAQLRGPAMRGGVAARGGVPPVAGQQQLQQQPLQSQQPQQQTTNPQVDIDTSNALTGQEVDNDFFEDYEY